MTNPRSLRSRRDFERVLAQGRRFRTSSGTFFTLARTDGQPARIGLAVASGIGGAVVRNRIKRRLREAFRATAPEVGIDVVVRARGGAAEVDFQKLEDDVRSAVAG